MDGQSYSQNAAAALRAEIKRIRSQIVDIVVEIDHVRLQEIPNIQAEYAVRIGGWEANLMQAELACRRAKRKLTLAQAKVNDGLVPDDVALEEQLTHPFTLIHMSDNGDTWRYVGRPSWSEVASGSIKNCQNDRGHKFSVYEWPQHYTVWHYDAAQH